jgi:hypothetical protein
MPEREELGQAAIHAAFLFVVQLDGGLVTSPIFASGTNVVCPTGTCLDEGRNRQVDSTLDRTILAAGIPDEPRA